MSVATKTILVVDDMRNYPFADGDVSLVARTSAEGVAHLAELRSLDELWLDFDLGGDDTAMPVALWLAERAFDGIPFEVGRIYIHTSNPVGRQAMGLLLRRFGYEVRDVEAHFGI